MKFFSFVSLLVTLSLSVAGKSYASSNIQNYLSQNQSEESDELAYTCYTSYVGPAAQERASCGASVELVDNSGYAFNYFSSSMSIPGSSSGSSCCSSAASDAMAKCRDAYSRSQRAGRCIEKNCNCTQYVRQP